jgi:hypothetical protein
MRTFKAPFCRSNNKHIRGDVMQLIQPGRRIALAAAAAFAMCVSTGAWAQDKAGNPKQQIIGTWTVVSVVVEQGGTKREPYGPNPKGSASYDRDGNFTYVLLRPDLPKIASNLREKPTPEEANAIATGILAIYGKYSVNPKDGSMEMKIEASSFPNWTGAQQKRMVAIKGDELRLINPTPPTGGGTAYVVWKRAK